MDVAVTKGAAAVSSTVAQEVDSFIKDLVGNVAVAVTIALFLTGIFICKDIYKRGGTSEVSPMPFLTCCVSCTVWLFYGLTVGDSSLCIVNAVGVVLQVLYLLFYYFMCSNKRDIHKKLCIMFATLATVVFIIFLYKEDVTRMSELLGYIASSCTLIFMGSPLVDIATVVRTKSTNIMPFPLIFTSFLMALLWSIYGIIIHDRVVQIPNMLATFVTVVQLLLFVVYREGPKLINL